MTLGEMYPVLKSVCYTIAPFNIELFQVHPNDLLFFCYWPLWQAPWHGGESKLQLPGSHYYPNASVREYVSTFSLVSPVIWIFEIGETMRKWNCMDSYSHWPWWRSLQEEQISTIPRSASSTQAQTVWPIGLLCTYSYCLPRPSTKGSSPITLSNYCSYSLFHVLVLLPWEFL